MAEKSNETASGKKYDGAWIEIDRCRVNDRYSSYTRVLGVKGKGCLVSTEIFFGSDYGNSCSATLVFVPGVKLDDDKTKLVRMTEEDYPDA